MCADDEEIYSRVQRNTHQPMTWRIIVIISAHHREAHVPSRVRNAENRIHSVLYRDCINVCHSIDSKSRRCRRRLCAVRSSMLWVVVVRVRTILLLLVIDVCVCVRVEYAATHFEPIYTAKRIKNLWMNRSYIWMNVSRAAARVH